MNHPSHPSTPGPGDALIVVDVQNDFLPGGALGVRGGDKVVPVLNEYLRRFARQGLPLFATRDWHPPGHCSFKGSGGPWPEHCVAGTAGAAFARELSLPADVRVISKATAIDQEVYSSFCGTDLAEQLRQSGVRRLFIGGLATDYCVRFTVRDAIGLGLRPWCCATRCAQSTRRRATAMPPSRKCGTWARRKPGWTRWRSARPSGRDAVSAATMSAFHAECAGGRSLDRRHCRLRISP